jgi:hypothetical protein
MGIPPFSLHGVGSQMSVASHLLDAYKVTTIAHYSFRQAAWQTEGFMANYKHHHAAAG